MACHQLKQEATQAKRYKEDADKLRRFNVYLSDMVDVRPDPSPLCLVTSYPVVVCWCQCHRRLAPAVLLSIAQRQEQPQRCVLA